MADEYIRKADAVEALDGKIIVTGHKNADTVLQYMKDISNKIKSLKPADVVPVIRCRDCKYSHMTYDGKCKYCDIWFPDEDEYMDGDYFCASAEQR